MSNTPMDLVIVYVFGAITAFLNIFLPPTPGLFQSLIMTRFDAKTVVIISLMCAFWSAIARVIIFRRELIKKDLSKIVLSGILGSLLGGYFIGVLSNDIVTLVIFGFVLKAYLDYKFNKIESAEVTEINHTKADIFISGFVANFITAIGGVSGIRKNFYLAKGYSMQQTLGTISVLQIFAMFFGLLPRFLLGEVELHLVLYLAPIFFVSMVIVWIGRKILIKIPNNIQKKAVSYLLLFSVVLILPSVIDVLLKIFN